MISFKGKRDFIANLKCVNEVVIQETVALTDNLKRIQPDIVIKGDDWDDNSPSAEYMSRHRQTGCEN